MGTSQIVELASPLEQTKCDSGAVNIAAGIKFGLGVVLAAVANPARQGVNVEAATLPAGAEVEAAFGGIVLRSTVGQCDENGNGYVAYKKMAAVAKPNRAGFRVWVKANQTDIAYGDDVYWIIADETDHGFDIGSFSNVAIAEGGDTDTVKLTEGKFVSGVQNGMVLVEFKK